MSHSRIIETTRLSIGLEKYSTEKIDLNCEPCVKAKQHRSIIPKRTANHRATEPLARVHSDYCGPYSTRSKGGANGVFLFIDDNTRFPELTFVHSKSEALPSFQNFTIKYETMTGYKVKILRSDCEGEYSGSGMVDYCKMKGIQQELTAPHLSFQDGVAERFFQTLNDMIRVFHN